MWGLFVAAAEPADRCSPHGAWAPAGLGSEPARRAHESLRQASWGSAPGGGHRTEDVVVVSPLDSSAGDTPRGTHDDQKPVRKP